MGWLSRLFGGEPSPQPNRSMHLEGDGSFEFDIVGESHYQDALARIVGGRSDESAEFDCIAAIICEDDNPHDENAVAIYINGQKVGHLARPVAAGYRDMLKKHGWVGWSITADAMIVGGWDRGARGRGDFGVKLDI
ncbi:hypothetical protein PE067_09410 [Paracoccus sp. DMF-8]|uniref:hypothetical protein n=1 Tax=Paracoccus sp. DMF-8 TaxID=3019445 RepID=UPI0023E7791F|nr:hypothetical protein [Paracoccus sp. DMF-8]MDF3606336.1 hypothetical protein [Paracoccus sp. DMF-8]